VCMISGDSEILKYIKNMDFLIDLTLHLPLLIGEGANSILECKFPSALRRGVWGEVERQTLAGNTFCI
jgi:hypothetical protein